jgi:hypothetical protein
VFKARSEPSTGIRIFCFLFFFIVKFLSHMDTNQFSLQIFLCYFPYDPPYRAIRLLIRVPESAFEVRIVFIDGDNIFAHPIFY